MNTLLQLSLGAVPENLHSIILGWAKSQPPWSKPKYAFAVEDELMRLYPDMQIKTAEEHTKQYLLEAINGNLLDNS